MILLIVAYGLINSMSVHVSAADAPSAILHAFRPISDSVYDYPRIASIYSLKLPDQPTTFARYGIVIANGSAGASGAVQAVKAANPNTKIILYDNTSAVDVPSFDAMSLYPGWWLTLAGTRLAVDVDATTTTISVVDAGIIARFLASNPDVVVDGETMHVLSVDTKNNTLKVKRGYYSVATPHHAGVRIAAHATKWPQTWLLNVTPYCPVDPATGQTWIEYQAHFAESFLAQAPWDGLLWDDGNTSFAFLSDGQLDADNDNVADAGNGPSGTGWQDGVTRLLSLTHALIPNKLQLVTDAYYPGLTDGEEMEHFPYYANGWASGFDTYLQLAGPGKPAHFTIISADTANASDTFNSGMQNLQQIRFDLATTLMGNGYFAYDFGPQNHGQTWWYDEYDEGAGSSLLRQLNATQTQLFLAAGTGVRFKVGDIVNVPDDNPLRSASGDNDEQMLVTGVNHDTLTVLRGYNSTTPTTHAQLTKVLTQAQIVAGQGWLGQPLSAAASMLPLRTPSQLIDGSFEESQPGESIPWKLQVSAPATAEMKQDTRTFSSGGSSARIQITKADPSNPWNVALFQQSTKGPTSLRLTRGKSYTLTFWAKAMVSQTIGAGLQQSVSPWSGRAYQNFSLTTQWQPYSLSFVAPVTESAVRVQFNLGQATGTIWLDNVSFQQGDPNLWRRNFTHGTVLLNATNSPQSVLVGPGYRRIKGTQDPAINNGKGAMRVTLAPQDALLLIRTN